MGITLLQNTNLQTYWLADVMAKQHVEITSQKYSTIEKGSQKREDVRDFAQTVEM
jgi:hypothetical protein